MKTKEQLQKELRDIEEKEAEVKAEKDREKNYKMFLERKPDAVIGLAHCDIGITKIDYDWHRGRFFSIGDAISIHGNCGTSYKAQAPITSATHTYFHNVWTHQQRQSFQEKLNKVALKEIQKIMGTLLFKLEILGLQYDSWFQQALYPEKMVPEMRKVLWAETKKLLDGYKDSEFKNIGSFSHGGSILKLYLKENRPKLYQAKYPNE